MSKIINIEFKKTDGKKISIRPSRVAIIEELPNDKTKIVISSDFNYEIDEKYASVHKKVFDDYPDSTPQSEGKSDDDLPF